MTDLLGSLVFCFCDMSSTRDSCTSRGNTKLESTAGLSSQSYVVFKSTATFGQNSTRTEFCISCPKSRSVGALLERREELRSFGLCPLSGAKTSRHKLSSGTRGGMLSLAGEPSLRGRE